MASILDISITANTTRIILWNFLENIPFPLHGTVLKDQVINSFISYFTNICNVFLCDCFSNLSYCGHFSQKNCIGLRKEGVGVGRLDSC